MKEVIETSEGVYHSELTDEGNRIFLWRAPGVSRDRDMPKTSAILADGWHSTLLEEVNGNCVEVYQRIAQKRIAA